MATTPLSRRALLAGAATAAGGARLGFLSPLAGCTSLVAYEPPANLVVVFANGGLRSQDFLDVHFDGADSHRTYTTEVEKSAGLNWSAADLGVYTDIPTNTNRIYLALSSPGFGDVYASYNARGLFYRSDGTVRSYVDPTDFRGPLGEVLTVVRNVDLETASHPTGKIIALNGRNSTQVPAAPVIVANAAFGGAGVTSTFRSWNMGYPLTQGDLPPSIPGEPADLNDLLTDLGLSNSGAGSAVDLALNAAWAAENTRFATALARDSLFHDAAAAHADAQAMLKQVVDIGGVPSPLADVFDVSSGTNPFANDTANVVWKQRFYGALRGITNGVTPIVTIDMTGFDTHNEDHAPYATDLGNLIGTLLEELHLAGRLVDTLVVVVSDFDRTPTFNDRGGTDHWPAGPMFLFGSGLLHGAFGEKQDTLTAVAVDPATGLSSADGTVLTRQHVWASILEMFAVPNPQSYMNLGAVVPGVLA